PTDSSLLAFSICSSVRRLSVTSLKTRDLADRPAVYVEDGRGTAGDGPLPAVPASAEALLGQEGALPPLERFLRRSASRRPVHVGGSGHGAPRWHTRAPPEVPEV